jgi:hypothetical protein
MHEYGEEEEEEEEEGQYPDEIEDLDVDEIKY